MVHPTPPCIHASCSLVEAYLQPSGRAGTGCPNARLGTTPLANSFSPQLVLSAQAAETAPWRLPRLRESGRSRTSAAELLEGTWSPPRLRQPKSAGSSVAPSETLALAAEKGVRRVRFSMGTPGSSIPECRNIGSSRCSSAASSCVDNFAEHLCGGSVAGGSAAITHATTPSWRSRSFPQPPRVQTGHCRENKGSNASERRIKEEADSTDGCAANRKLERNRLPPLPMEARWRHSELHRCKAPPSELQRLKAIDEHVREANAMLVDSFLKIKRQPPPDDRCGTMDAEPSCGDSVTASSYL